MSECLSEWLGGGDGKREGGRIAVEMDGGGEDHSGERIE